jgi:hypothetical protein
METDSSIPRLEEPAPVPIRSHINPVRAPIPIPEDPS